MAETGGAPSPELRVILAAWWGVAREFCRGAPKRIKKRPEVVDPSSTLAFDLTGPHPVSRPPGVRSVIVIVPGSGSSRLKIWYFRASTYHLYNSLCRLAKICGQIPIQDLPARRFGSAANHTPQVAWSSRSRWFGELSSAAAKLGAKEASELPELLASQELESVRSQGRLPARCAAFLVRC